MRLFGGLGFVALWSLGAWYLGAAILYCVRLFWDAVYGVPL